MYHYDYYTPFITGATMRKGRRPGKDSLQFEEKSKSAAGGWWSPPSLWTQEKNAGQAQDDADDLPGQQNVFIKQDAYTCQKERHTDIGQE